MKNILETTIHPQDTGQRIDIFLMEYLSPLSRTKTQKLIKCGDVLVNKKIVKKNYKLKNDDIITYLPLNVPIKNISTDKPSKKTPIKANNIIKATNDYLIINKPSGIVVHPDSKHCPEETLIGSIIKLYPEIKNVGENALRPGIVHRLDKSVSGVMVIARTQSMFFHLKNQFKKQKIQKEYICLVHGTILKDEVVINLSIKRKKNGYMAAVPPSEKNARRSTTILCVEKYFKNYTLLKVQPKTGRTHQIRVHLFAYGHPIVGEQIYTTKKYKTKDIKKSFTKLFLHSYQIKFSDQENNTVCYKTKLEPSLQKILAVLKKE